MVQVLIGTAFAVNLSNHCKIRKESDPSVEFGEQVASRQVGDQIHSPPLPLPHHPHSEICKAKPQLAVRSANQRSPEFTHPRAKILQEESGRATLMNFNLTPYNDLHEE